MATRRRKSKEADKSNREFFDAIRQFEVEGGIPADYMIEKIRKAIIAAVKGQYNQNDNVEVNIDADTDTFDVFIRQEVVEEVSDKTRGHCLTLDQARLVDPRAEIGSVVNIRLEPKQFGRIAATTAKHVIRQGIRDMEREQVYAELRSRNQEIVSAQVTRVDLKSGAVAVKIGNCEVLLPKGEQAPGDHIEEGDIIKVYVIDTRDTEPHEGERPARATISRVHPGLVKRLFETEVPEIFDGTVEIKAISREAGSRTKMAVLSHDENVDAVGACIGPRGSRVNAIVEELGGEKIDIIKYSDDPVEFVAKALSPAEVIRVTIDEEQSTTCHVVVPDDQLSLAIGNKGQNARLAARLTGLKIDIRPASQYSESEE